jgi:hypothetical protein
VRCIADDEIFFIFIEISPSFNTLEGIYLLIATMCDIFLYRI